MIWILIGLLAAILAVLLTMAPQWVRNVLTVCLGIPILWLIFHFLPIWACIAMCGVGVLAFVEEWLKIRQRHTE